MFSQSHHLTVNGGNFLAVDGDYRSNIQVYKRLGIDILLDAIAKGALHNSGERFDPPRCHPNTRTAVLQKITSWIQDQSPSSPDFMWIYGPAGSGKSAIAQSIAELCVELGLLIETFFFSRSAAGRNDDKRLVATIAYQIAQSFSEARPFITNAVEQNPALLSLTIEAQLMALIIEPLSKSLKTLGLHHNPRHLIILDGLDECHDPKAQTTIIRAFTQLVTLHQLPFAILFTSRAEYHIREAFNDKRFKTRFFRIALDNTLWHADNDIREFLTSRFMAIRETHRMRFYIPQVWPSCEAIDELVEKSSGQFIYSSTVIKYIESQEHRPTDRLDVVLGLQSVENGTPFAELDNLYLHILSSVADYGLVSQILGFLLQPRELWNDNIPLRRPGFIDMFFSLPVGSVHLALANLHSIMNVPEHDDFISAIDIIHASFWDFLSDPSRSGIYFLEPSCFEAGLAILCMENIANHHRASDTYIYSLKGVLEHCSRARLTPELLRNLSSFDLLGWIKSTIDLSVTNEVLSSLPRYFTWLCDQIDLGAQDILLYHLKIFDYCLLSEIHEHHYNENTIWCYMIFEGKLSLQSSAWLLGELGSVSAHTFFPQNQTQYFNFLRQFFFNRERAGTYTMTESIQGQTTVLVLERLKSMAHNRLDFLSRQYMAEILNSLPTAVPPSHNLFGQVSSILSADADMDMDMDCRWDSKIDSENLKQQIEREAANRHRQWLFRHNPNRRDRSRGMRKQMEEERMRIFLGLGIIKDM